MRYGDEELGGRGPGRMLDRVAFLSCRWPRAPALPVGAELFAFTQNVKITLFDLGRPGEHLCYVIGYVDVAAREDIGRS